MASYNTPYDIITPPGSSAPFQRFGKLLPILMLSLLPCLLLLYVAKRFDWHYLFVGVSILTMILIISSTILIVISGLVGYLELRKYQKLANPNTHPRPRR